MKAYAGIAGPIIEKTLAEVSGKGIDAKAAQAFIAEQMKAYGK